MITPGLTASFSASGIGQAPHRVSALTCAHKSGVVTLLIGTDGASSTFILTPSGAMDLASKLLDAADAADAAREKAESADMEGAA